MIARRGEPQEADKKRTKMVDNLRQSLDQLEPPTCPHCQLEMKWVRSTLVADSPVTIAHLFQCVNCNRVSETRSKTKAQSVPPGKLSAPQRRDAVAA